MSLCVVMWEHSHFQVGESGRKRLFELEHGLSLSSCRVPRTCSLYLHTHSKWLHFILKFKRQIVSCACGHCEKEFREADMDISGGEKFTPEKRRKGEISIHYLPAPVLRSDSSQWEHFHVCSEFHFQASLPAPIPETQAQTHLKKRIVLLLMLIYYRMICTKKINL